MSSQKKRKNTVVDGATDHSGGQDAVKRVKREGTSKAEDVRFQDAATLANGTSNEDKALSKIEGSQLEGNEGKQKTKKQKDHRSSTAPWKLSEPIGGKFTNTDPLFTEDEKYLILAKESAIQIYSTSTSLLVRNLSVGGTQTITGYVLSPNRPDTLYVSTVSGLIFHWDWVEGKRLGRWDIGSRIYGLGTPSRGPDTPDEDVVYTLDKKKEKWMITAHKLRSGAEASKTELATIWKSTKPLTAFKIVQGGKVIVATGGERLMIGVTERTDSTSLSKLKYVWREFASTERITCLDVRESSSTPRAGNSKKSKAKSSPSIDVVVGGLKGAIFVHEDLLNKLIQRERPDKSNESGKMAPSQLHWHREAVASVKWSLDGNYIISGGSETVLVLWQVETGRHQYLPHLSTAIESVVVSPSGSSYGIRLADNSAMVLSTTELKPKANVAGIQIRSSKTELYPKGQMGTLLKTVDSLESAANDIAGPDLSATPAAISPLNPSQILLAVPASQSGSSSGRTNAPYLQTFDFSSSHHVSRQAITRTNATTLNIGPEANKIGEPDVKLLSVSHDGQWLATVDEWVPPRRDVEPLTLDALDTADEQNRRREVFLKFWAWKAETKDWELVTRVDAPHACLKNRSGGAAGRVLDLVTDPVSQRFATVGEDGVVRMWEPRTRYRDGVVVRGRNAEALVNWSCRHTVELECPTSVEEYNSNKPTPSNTNANEFITASLAFSPDGSLLAAAVQLIPSQSPLIHLIDATAIRSIYTFPILTTGPLTTMAFTSRHLIIVSDALILWDVVTNALHFGFSLRPTPNLTPAQRKSMTHLAVHPQASTFALALPTGSSQQHPHPHLAVFDPESPVPLWTTSLPRPLTALLPSRVQGGKGYVALDSAAEIRMLSPRVGGGEREIEMVGPMVKGEESLRGIEAIYGAGGGEDVSEEKRERQDTDMVDISHPADDDDDDEGAVLKQEPDDDGAAAAAATTDVTASKDDRPVVRPAQLRTIFDVAPAFALPAVGDLFEQVVGLLGRRKAAPVPVPVA